MPPVHPFTALQYTKATTGPKADVSDLIAPPYDVLDLAAKLRLTEKNPRNIVAIDLPHIPPKDAGPPPAYTRAGTTLHSWLADGTLTRSKAPVMFAYRQTFTHYGKTTKRTGMACTLDIQAFGARPGGGILPHEQTFSGPREDRLALMKATTTQLSPIFGLHADEKKTAAKLLATLTTREPDVKANIGGGADGTLHELWTINDPAAHAAYSNALTAGGGEDVFIADGHHRYTTAMQYLADLDKTGQLSPDHPARRCLFVLISMSDPGLVIGPTHRVLGGMKNWSWMAFTRAAASHLTITAPPPPPAGLAPIDYLERNLSTAPANTVGLYDYTTGSCFLAAPSTPDPLAATFPSKPKSWRTLDVALIQHLIVERICQPKLNGGEPVKWSFPHTIAEVKALATAPTARETGIGMAAAPKPQLAIIVRPTPLSAVRDISRAGELMPQKSTFFLPKLATGLFMYPVG